MTTESPPMPPITAIRSDQQGQFPFERPLPIVPFHTANLGHPPGAPDRTDMPGKTHGHPANASTDAAARDAPTAFGVSRISIVAIGLFAIALCLSALMALALT